MARFNYAGLQKPAADGTLFAPKKFGRTVSEAMSAKGLSVRYMTGETGISPATICRITQGKAPSVENYLRLCVWLAAP
jgi:transcriptional regulator with XRE-family HTH domain